MTPLLPKQVQSLKPLPQSGNHLLVKVPCSLIGVFFAAVGSMFAIMSPMIFDAPKSTGNAGLYGVLLSCLAAPFCGLATAILSWRNMQHSWPWRILINAIPIAADIALMAASWGIAVLVDVITRKAA